MTLMSSSDHITPFSPVTQPVTWSCLSHPLACQCEHSVSMTLLPCSSIWIRVKNTSWESKPFSLIWDVFPCGAVGFSDVLRFCSISESWEGSSSPPPPLLPLSLRWWWDVLSPLIVIFIRVSRPGWTTPSQVGNMFLHASLVRWRYVSKTTSWVDTFQPYRRGFWERNQQKHRAVSVTSLEEVWSSWLGHDWS